MEYREKRRGTNPSMWLRSIDLESLLDGVIIEEVKTNRTRSLEQLTAYGSDRLQIAPGRIKGSRVYGSDTLDCDSGRTGG